MDTQYWGLPSLANFIRWLEELIALMSKPFLMVGFIISMVDLLTQGRLLDIWLIYYGWAIIQAVAVDACFFVTWHKAKKAFTSYHWFQFLGYSLLGLALGVVAWAAMDLQSLEQAVGISNAEALARLNLNPILLTHLRSLVAVIMGGVVAMISPEDKANVSIKKGKKWSINFRALALKLGIKVQPIAPPQNEEKTFKIQPSKVVNTTQRIEQETAKNEQQKTVSITNNQPMETANVAETNPVQFERFAWPEDTYVQLGYQQDFILIEHVKPVAIEPVFSESKEPESEPIEEEQKPQSEQMASRRTMTIDEVINATGLTERKVRNLINKRTLKVTPRNKDRVLISSVDEWLRIAPNSKETGELPVVQLANNNHH